MDHRQYEAYVTNVVKGLSISENAKIHRNRKYPGIRQPGSYEIDIACELYVDNALFFLIIVECKNWKNPVDRPQIQKLIQTRDAINAHKAAFASPVGYTKEAIEVAKANGIALWVISQGIFDVSAGGGAAALSVAMTISDNLRQYIYGLIEYTGHYYDNLTLHRHFNQTKNRYEYLDVQKYNLVPFSWVGDKFDFSSGFIPTYWAIDPDASSKDPIMAELIAQIFNNLNSSASVNRRVANRILEYQFILINAGVKSEMVQEYIDEVMRMTIEDPIPPFGSWERLQQFDDQLDHSDTELLASIDWLKQNGEHYFIYVSPNVVPSVQLTNNIVWANVLWLLNGSGFL